MSNLDADKLKVFTGRANPELAQKICSHLQIPLGRGRTELFPDGELTVKVEEDVRGRDSSIGPDCVIGPFTCLPPESIVPEGTALTGNAGAGADFPLRNTAC